MPHTILRQVDQQVLSLTLNRPQKKNALTCEMYQSLNAALQSASNDPRIRVVVLQGSESCFCAGNDLHDFLDAGALERDHPAVQFLHTLSRFNKPLLAAAAGPAIGIGATLLLHCDLVYLANNCTLQMPFIDLALVPEAASSLLLPRITGHLRATEMLLLGCKIDAEQACHWGLANGVMAPQALNQQVQAIAIELAAKPPHAVLQTKALLKRHLVDEIEDTIERELAAFSLALQSEECRSAIAAFFEQKSASSQPD